MALQRTRDNRAVPARVDEVAQPEIPQEPVAPPIRISCVVISHNRRELSRRCLAALDVGEGRENYEIVFVDNGSRDGTAELESEFPNVKFVRLPKNFGLTKALNIGIRAAVEESEHLFLLHDDTELPTNAVHDLMAVLESDPEIGAAAPLLVDESGNPAPQLNDFPPGQDWTAVTPAGDRVEVDYTSGAAILLRRFFVKAMQKIDERYGQFGSDAELCFKIRSGGKKIVVVPSVRARHAGHDSEDSLRSADRAIGRAEFIGKHYGFGAGLKSRIGAIFSALGGFRLGEFFKLLSGQKIDGSHE